MSFENEEKQRGKNGLVKLDQVSKVCSTDHKSCKMLPKERVPGQGILESTTQYAPIYPVPRESAAVLEPACSSLQNQLFNL